MKFISFSVQSPAVELLARGGGQCLHLSVTGALPQRLLSALHFNYKIHHCLVQNL